VSEYDIRNEIDAGRRGVSSNASYDRPTALAFAVLHGLGAVAHAINEVAHALRQS
jgi:hypothetical protein